jgi:DNA invertase Pin-like site-specific DNA recombinase
MATPLLSVMGAFAEFDRTLILERQRDGIAAATQRGAYTGRKLALTAQQAQQLRHAHATELVNAEVSIEAVRRRLDMPRPTGHVSTETTQLYALLDDKIADAEIRAARLRTRA